MKSLKNSMFSKFEEKAINDASKIVGGLSNVTVADHWTNGNGDPTSGKWDTKNDYLGKGASKAAPAKG